MDNSITMPNSGAPLVGASDFILVTMKGMEISTQTKKENAKKKTNNNSKEVTQKKKVLAKKIVEYRKQNWMGNPLVTEQVT